MAENLRTLQRCILDIALEFKRICEKNNLKYFLAYGSLLGAVRHGGFIPWDDDMDVGMPREDYEKFLEICEKELSDEFFFQTCETDKGHGFGYAKIRLNGTVMKEDYAENSCQHNGIFLDIFPYDAMPQNKLLQKIQFRMYKCIKWAALGKTDYDFVLPKRRRFAKAMKILFFPFKRNTLCKMENRVCRMYEKSGTDKLINMEWYRGVLDISDLEDMKTLKFEGYDFAVPNRYHEHLTSIYKDYMTPPPVEKRGIQHTMVECSKGDYVIKNNAPEVTDKE